MTNTWGERRRMRVSVCMYWLSFRAHTSVSQPCCLNTISQTWDPLWAWKTCQAAHHKLTHTHTLTQLNQTFFRLALLTDNWRNKLFTTIKTAIYFNSKLKILNSCSLLLSFNQNCLNYGSFKKGQSRYLTPRESSCNQDGHIFNSRAENQWDMA